MIWFWGRFVSLEGWETQWQWAWWMSAPLPSNICGWLFFVSWHFLGFVGNWWKGEFRFFIWWAHYSLKNPKRFSHKLMSISTLTSPEISLLFFFTKSAYQTRNYKKKRGRAFPHFTLFFFMQSQVAVLEVRVWANPYWTNQSPNSGPPWNWLIIPGAQWKNQSYWWFWLGQPYSSWL